VHCQFIHTITGLHRLYPLKKHVNILVEMVNLARVERIILIILISTHKTNPSPSHYLGAFILRSEGYA
jgi:hypothetical protein